MGIGGHKLGLKFYGRVTELRNRLSRARFFRGHGVHSPFVYDVVRNVFMRDTLLPGDRALFRELLAAGVPERRAVQLQNLAIHCGYASFGLNRADAEFCIATRGLSRAETLALVGESGSGKTTAGKAILRLLGREAKISGSIRICGEDTASPKGKNLKALRQAAQIIFQDPFSSLDPRMTVGETLLEALESLRPDMSREEKSERIRGLLSRVGLREDALRRYPHEFSGGQRQRIAIARALAPEPKLIICDEPTSALDVSVQAQILTLLGRIQRETGIAYLLITHNFGVVEYIADRVAVMRSGKIVEEGPLEDVLQHPASAYTRELLDAVPRLGGI